MKKATKQTRKTARRKDRQHAALAALKKKFPHAREITHFGAAKEITYAGMSDRQKQQLIEGYRCNWERRF